MTPLFAKLNLKDHRAILVLNGPKSFDAELSQLPLVSYSATAPLCRRYPSR